MAHPSRQTSSHSAAAPMLGIAAVLTLAWFTAAAIAISPPAASNTATGYGIDELPLAQQLAQR